jgi:hypothetical protein
MTASTDLWRDVFKDGRLDEVSPRLLACSCAARRQLCPIGLCGIYMYQVAGELLGTGDSAHIRRHIERIAQLQFGGGASQLAHELIIDR